MRRALLVSVAVMTAIVPARADLTADFLGEGVFGLKSDCAKLAKLAAGGPRNIQTVPETLTRNGYRSWEGACSITRIAPHRSLARYTVELKCSEGAEENMKRTEVWTKRGDTLYVQFEGKTETYVKCETSRAHGKQ